MCHYSSLYDLSGDAFVDKNARWSLFLETEHELWADSLMLYALQVCFLDQRLNNQMFLEKTGRVANASNQDCYC